MKTANGKQKKSKAVKTRQDFIQYIRQLDRLHWEFLRLSDAYQKDWQKYLDEVIVANDLDIRTICNECEFGIPSEQCTDCEKLAHFRQYPQSYLHINAFRSDWDIASYYEALSEDATDILMRYGMRFIADPSLPYEQVMAELMEEDDSSHFNLSDLSDADGFIESIGKSADAQSVYMKSHFPDGFFSPADTGAKIERRKKKEKKLSKRERENVRDESQNLLLKALNSLIDDYDLLNKIKVKLPKKSQSLMDYYSLNAMYRHRNRVLLEVAYPDFILSSHHDFKSRWHDRFIFYTYLHEYAIYEGIYPIPSTADVPFITLTINVTAPVDYSVEEEFRQLISKRRKEFYKNRDAKKIRTRWTLPNGFNCEATERKLNVWQKYKAIEKELSFPNYDSLIVSKLKNDYFKAENNNNDYDELSNELADRRDNRKLPTAERERAGKLLQLIGGKKDKIDNRIDDYLKEIKDIMTNVEQGIFP